MGRTKRINLNEMKALYDKGLSDNEIAKKLDCTRELIRDRRHKLGLSANYWKSSIWNDSDYIKQLYAEGKSSAEISKICNVSVATLTKFKKQFNIKTDYDIKMSSEDVEKAMNLANKGMTDTEIAKIFRVSRAVIEYHRRNRKVQSQFTYDKISKIHKNEFEELFNKGLNDTQIAKELNVSSDGVYGYRMRNGYLRESYKEAKNNPLTQDNLEIILGIMMGDGSMECPNKNARMTFAHCPKQKDYTYYVAEKLSNLNPYTYYHKGCPDKRTGKCYDSYWCGIPTNPALNEIYKCFYKDGKKRIPFELFTNFTWQSLAYMYMDDGNKQNCGGRLATNCFSKKEIDLFREFLKVKFNLETSHCKDNTIYIKAESFRYMKSQIEPYMCECMKYKIR